MTKLICFLLTLTFCACGGAPFAMAQQFVENQNQSNPNYFRNSGFENKSALWTVAAGTRTYPTVSGDKISGQGFNLAFTSINGTLLSQTYASCADLEGKNLLAGIHIKTPSSNIEVCSQVNGVDQQCVPVPSGGTKLEFISATMVGGAASCGMRVKTTTTTTGDITADAARLEENRLGTVAQAEARLNASRITSNQTVASIAETTLVYNTVASPYFDAYGEFNSTTGIWTSKYSGRLIVDVQGSITNGSAELFVIRLRRDGLAGTTVCAWVDVGNINQFAWNLTGCAVDVAVGTKLQITSDSTADASYDFVAGTSASFRIVSVPSANQIIQNPLDSAWYIDANLAGANPSLGVTAVTTYTEIADAGLTLTPASGSAPVGVMCSGTNAATAPSSSPTVCAIGSESAGFNALVPRAGIYEVCAYFSHAITAPAATSVSSTFQIIETPTNAQTLVQDSRTRLNSRLVSGAGGGTTESTFPQSSCGLLTFSSAGTKGIRLMFEQSVAGTPTTSIILADESAVNGQRNVRFTMKPFLVTTPAPLLVGSIASANSGMLKLEAARVTCAATSTVDSTSAAWISIGNLSGGNCVLTFTSPFLSPPWCVAQSINATQTTIIQPKLTGVTASGATLTSAQVSTGSSVIGSSTSTIADIHCLGQK